jgi:hypothetical protein
MSFLTQFEIFFKFCLTLYCAHNMLFGTYERTLKENCISTALFIGPYTRHTGNEKLSLVQNHGNQNLTVNLLTKTGPLPLSLDDSDNYI